MKFLIIFCLVFSAAFAGDFAITEVTPKTSLGRVGTRIFTGTKDGVKYYDRWIMDMTVSPTNPAPDSIEHFFIGDNEPFQVTRHNLRSSVVFRSVPGISVVARLDDPEVSKRSVAIIDTNNKKIYRWTPDEMGYFAQFSIEPLH